jgi:putative transposase
MLDVFSRYVVGWMVAHRESATLAQKFIGETCARQGIDRGQLTIHADRGPAMTSKPVALLLADLGVTKTHGRPHVSNDNPFSEAQFKTLKYRPDFPERFGAIQDARAHCHVFFPWYKPSTITAAWACSPPTTCTSAWPSSAWRPGRPCSPPPMPSTPNASQAAFPSRRACPTEVWINAPNTLGRLHAASRTRPSDLPTRAPSRSLPSVAALSERL